MHVCVGVGDDDQLVARVREAGVKLLGLAAIDGVADHAAAGVAGGCLDAAASVASVEPSSRTSTSSCG